MLNVSATQSSEVIVTLYEKCVNKVDPYFTWSIYNTETLNETIFYQDDTSASPFYYNSFMITVATYSGLTQGIINVPSGSYNYNIYETNAPYSLTYSTSSNLVETGMLIIKGDLTGNIVFGYQRSNIPVFSI